MQAPIRWASWETVLQRLPQPLCGPRLWQVGAWCLIISDLLIVLACCNDISLPGRHVGPAPCSTVTANQFCLNCGPNGYRLSCVLGGAPCQVIARHLK